MRQTAFSHTVAALTRCGPIALSVLLMKTEKDRARLCDPDLDCVRSLMQLMKAHRTYILAQSGSLLNIF